MFFLEKNILHVLVSKKNSPKFRPNFLKFGSFGGGRNFYNTEIENTASRTYQCKSSDNGIRTWVVHGVYTQNFSLITP